MSDTRRPVRTAYSTYAPDRTNQMSEPQKSRSNHQPPEDLARDDIQRSLDEIDKHEKTSNKKDKLRDKLEKFNKKRRKKGKPPLTYDKFRQRMWLKRIAILLIAIALVIIGIFGYRLVSSLGKTFNGNIFGVFQKQKLKQDANGRTNILIFGTSPEGWNGADLADSIMVLSYHQEKGDMYTVSLPRDLYVKHNCSKWLGTTAGKLNESYGCGKANASGNEAESAGQKEMVDAASRVLGLEIQYQIHANWKVLTDVVDNLGGIDVLVEAYDGSKSVYDAATKIRYKSGETVHLNGERALAFSRARGSAGGYGFSGGNFDRERNQQKILKAIIDKTKSSGKADINLMTKLLESLGNNISTNFETNELQAVVDLAQQYDSSKVKSIPLIDEKNNIRLMTTSNVNGASVVVPTAGTYDYSQIHRHIKKQINPTDLMREDAKVIVLNGSGVAGAAATARTTLTQKEINVTGVGNFTGGTQRGTVIYDLSGGKKPKTIEQISQSYGSNVQTTAPSSIQGYQSQADIVVVLGQ